MRKGWEQWLLSLEKAQVALNAQKYLMGGCKEDGAKLFSETGYMSSPKFVQISPTHKTNSYCQTVSPENTQLFSCYESTHLTFFAHTGGTFWKIYEKAENTNLCIFQVEKFSESHIIKPYSEKSISCLPLQSSCYKSTLLFCLMPQHFRSFMPL